MHHVFQDRRRRRGRTGPLEPLQHLNGFSHRVDPHDETDSPLRPPRDDPGLGDEPGRRQRLVDSLHLQLFRCVRAPPGSGPQSRHYRVRVAKQFPRVCFSASPWHKEDSGRRIRVRRGSGQIILKDYVSARAREKGLGVLRLLGEERSHRSRDRTGRGSLPLADVELGKAGPGGESCEEVRRRFRVAKRELETKTVVDHVNGQAMRQRQQPLPPGGTNQGGGEQAAQPRQKLAEGTLRRVHCNAPSFGIALLPRSKMQYAGATLIVGSAPTTDSPHEEETELAYSTLPTGTSK